MCVEQPHSSGLPRGIGFIPSEDQQIAGKRDGLFVILSRTRGIALPAMRREMRRRSAIEPIIGHLKADGRVERNYLASPKGDAVLCAAGRNTPLLARWIRLLFALPMAISLNAKSINHQRHQNAGAV